jgi:hypothetical protein
MMLNWTGYRRKWSLPNFKVLSRHLPGGTEDNYEDVIQDNRSPGHGLNPGPPENEEG